MRRLLAVALVVTALVAVPGSSRGAAGAPAEGDVRAFGDALPIVGSAGEDAVDLAGTATGAGWWAADPAGAVTAAGDAIHLGDLRAVALNRPIVAVAATPSGRGYWLVASDGGVFTFGDARFHGSTGAMRLNEPVVAMAPTPSGRGYWLVASDGGVFTFGDARFAGAATGAVTTDAAPSSRGGYWVLLADGTVRGFGGAAELGGARVRDGTAVGLVGTPSGLGYRFAVGRVRDVVTVWQPGGLRADSQAWAESVARAAGGRAVLRHRANLDLETARDSPWRIPLSLITYEPGAGRVLVGPSADAALARHEVVVGREAARRRNVVRGSVLFFIGPNGQRVGRSVGAIVPDARLSWAEIALATPDAAALGVNRPFAVDIWGAPRAALDDALARAAPSPHRLGIERSWSPPGPDGTLPNVRLKDLVGEPAYRHAAGDSIVLDPAWVGSSIATEPVPLLGRVTCHRAVLPALRGALADVAHAGLGAGLGRYGGCYNPRLIRGGDSGGFLSRHSFGIAVDVNTANNAFGGRVSMDPRIVDIFRRWGFAWGGTWVRPDGMHFEYAPG